MQVNKGDKIKLIRPMGSFTNVGEVCEVVNVTNEQIYFRFGGFNLGAMSYDEGDRYFEKYVEEKIKINTVSDELIEHLLSISEIKTETVFDKCTVVSVKLPSGFVIVESSACVDSVNYNEKIGKNICMNKIRDKLYELEGYKLQMELKELKSGGDADSMEDNEW